MGEPQAACLDASYSMNILVTLSIYGYQKPTRAEKRAGSISAKESEMHVT